MADTPFKQIATFYDRRVEKFGHDPRACDYGRRESQIKKFTILAQALDYSGTTVLDVGCGFADYAAFLSTRFKGVTYEGIDLSEKMIAQARIAQPGLNLRRANILEEPISNTHDIVTANGIFYLLGDDAPELMRALVEAMFARAKRCVAFNSLSSWAATHEENEFYADPVRVASWCREITPWVVLRHDYLPHDFTIYLYRDRTIC